MITLHACTACGYTLFPARLLCPRCGGASWTGIPCDGGVITSITTVQQTVLAELRTPQNIRIVARLQRAAPPGSGVALHEAEDGAVWGTSDADQT